MSKNDSKGYYSDLGVSPTASIEEIRAVYRALAKIYHPDLNKDRAASEKFKKITAAYEILSDSKKRAEYDNIDQQRVDTEFKNSQSRQPVEPIHCSKCGKITAQPRFLVFRSVKSFVLFTQTTLRRGVYCSECAPREAWAASLTSAILGWWGFPWGPILTVKEILRNALGGERVKEIEEQLNWQNALAFLDRNKPELALSLSKPLRTASTPEIAQAARHLTDHLMANGIQAYSLKSTWKLNVQSAAGQVLMGCAVPAIAYLLIAQPFSPHTGYYAAPYSPPSISTSSASSSNRPPTATPVKIKSQCAHLPVNNQIISGRSSLIRGGHELTIRNGSSGDAIVKVRDSSNRRLVVSFYVRKNMSATIKGIPDGAYRVQFGYGDALNSTCDGFLDPIASEFEDTEVLRTKYRSDGIYTSVLSFTLYAVTGGNTTIDGISDAAFNQ